MESARKRKKECGVKVTFIAKKSREKEKPFWRKTYFQVHHAQCDQMDRLLVQYLAIYNNENLPNIIKNLPK